jgi:hypothetical protein
MEVGGLVDTLKTIPVEASDAFRRLKRNLFLIIRELLLERPGYLKSEGISKRRYKCQRKTHT